MMNACIFHFMFFKCKFHLQFLIFLNVKSNLALKDHNLNYCAVILQPESYTQDPAESEISFGSSGISVKKKKKRVLSEEADKSKLGAL